MKKSSLLWVVYAVAVLIFVIPAFAVPVPDTGQTSCYNNPPDYSTTSAVGVVIPCPSPGQALYGQDAVYSINPMSYTKLDASGNDLPASAGSWVMVRDNVTGLVWEMKNNKDGQKDYRNPHDSDNNYTWYDSNPATNGGNAGTTGYGTTDTESFIIALNNSSYGGFSDWRLPTIKELALIEDYGRFPGPTIDGFFQNTQSDIYWSDTSIKWNSSGAWAASFDSGDIGTLYKSTSLYARAVRGAKDQPVYKNNGDGTVTDTTTGLMWQQDVSDNDSIAWDSALEYCENLSLGGHTDWRLPTTKELSSLVDFRHYSPALYDFPGTVSNKFYWTSTTNVDCSWASAWTVNFESGHITAKNKVYPFSVNSVRAVRGGQGGVVPDPSPRIKANGQSGMITVKPNTPVSITVSLDPMDQNGELGDWCIAYYGASGWQSLGLNGWAIGINVLFQWPLASLPDIEVFNATMPTVGDYLFCFIVDISPDYAVDAPFYYDYVQVHVAE